MEINKFIESYETETRKILEELKERYEKSTEMPLGSERNSEEIKILEDLYNLRDNLSSSIDNLQNYNRSQVDEKLKIKLEEVLGEVEKVIIKVDTLDFGMKDLENNLSLPDLSGIDYKEKEGETYFQNSLDANIGLYDYMDYLESRLNDFIEWRDSIEVKYSDSGDRLHAYLDVKDKVDDLVERMNDIQVNYLPVLKKEAELSIAERAEITNISRYIDSELHVLQNTLDNDIKKAEREVNISLIENSVVLSEVAAFENLNKEEKREIASELAGEPRKLRQDYLNLRLIVGKVSEAWEKINTIVNEVGTSFIDKIKSSEQLFNEAYNNLFKKDRIFEDLDNTLKDARETTQPTRRHLEILMSYNRENGIGSKIESLRGESLHLENELKKNLDTLNLKKEEMIATKESKEREQGISL